MGSQIGSVLGVAILVVILGAAPASTSNLDHLVRFWWWDGLLAFLAAGASLSIPPRRATLMVVEGSEMRRHLASLSRRMTRNDPGRFGSIPTAPHPVVDL